MVEAISLALLAGVVIHTLIGHLKPDYDLILCLWCFRRPVVRKVFKVSSDYREYYVPAGEPRERDFRRLLQKIGRKVELTAKLLLQYGHLGIDWGGLKFLLDHHGERASDDSTSIALLLEHLQAAAADPNGPLSDSEREELMEFVDTLTPFAMLASRNDADGTDTAVVDGSAGASETPSTPRTLRNLIVGLNELMPREPRKVTSFVYMAFDGIYEYLKRNPDKDSEMDMRFLNLYSYFLPEVEHLYGPSSGETAMFRHWAEEAYRHLESEWNLGLQHCLDPERTTYVVIERPLATFGDVLGHVISREESKFVLAEVKRMLDRYSVLPSVSDMLTEIVRAGILPQALDRSDIEFVASRVREDIAYTADKVERAEEITSGQQSATAEDYRGSLISALRYAMKRKKVLRPRKARDLVVCFIRSESCRASQVARFGPGDMPKADIVVQWVGGGKFMISTRKDLELPEDMIQRIRIADLYELGYRGKLGNVHYEQLKEAGRHAVEIGGERVELLYWTDYRKAFGNSFRSNPFARRTRMRFAQLVNIVRDAIENGPRRPAQAKREFVPNRKSGNGQVKGGRTSAATHRVTFARNAERNRWEAVTDANDLLFLDRKSRAKVEAGRTYLVVEIRAVATDTDGFGRIVAVDLTDAAPARTSGGPHRKGGNRRSSPRGHDRNGRKHVSELLK